MLFLQPKTRKRALTTPTLSYMGYFRASLREVAMPRGGRAVPRCEDRTALLLDHSALAAFDEAGQQGNVFAFQLLDLLKSL